jgi:nucleoside 2-deoxyribosyltransferase
MAWPKYLRNVERMAIKIYLGGPDVFLPDANRIGLIKRDMCGEFGFVGLYPLDNTIDGEPTASAIFNANRRLLDSADIGLFNLSPFRGPSADAGTVFELGFLFARGKTVCGYSSVEANYRARIEASGRLKMTDGLPRDADGAAVENFGLADNLMIMEAIRNSNGVFVASAEQSGVACAGLAALAAFRLCLTHMQQRFAPATSPNGAPD